MMELSSSKPLKPSELRSAFSNAKEQAERHAKVKILEFTSLTESLKNATRPNISSVPIDKPVFQPTPVQVWIEEYTPFHTHQTKISFRNADTCARRLRIEQITSPFFKVLPCSSNKHKETLMTGKVAAGMEICFILEFYPKEIIEYQAEVICCTEREKFAIPIFTKGKHAIIDIPDVIHFGDCPVKVPTTRVMTLHNVGSRSATFSFKCTDCDTFRVSPHMVLLEPKGIGMQLELIFTPSKLTCDNGDLIVSDDSGQTMIVQLVASVHNLAVYLSQSALDLPSTYITLTTRKSVRIHNESEYPLNISWKAFRDIAKEEQERGRMLNELTLMEEAEQAEQQQITDNEETEQVSIVTAQLNNPFHARKTIEARYRNLRRAALEDVMHFVSDQFTIEPSVGCVWAQSTLDVIVTFTPLKASSYSTVAFLEIAGQEERLMLRIRGKAIGPKVKVIDHETLDFGEVVINNRVTKSFTIQNQGEIIAHYTMVPSTETMDTDDQSNNNDTKQMTVSPARGILDLKETSNITVTFCASKVGELSESVSCELAGSDRILIVRLKAIVILPTFLVDTEEIDFGIVSYSFEATKSIRVTNTSDIFFYISLSIAEEEKYRKKEVEILPSSSGIESKGVLDIQISFTPFNIKRYDYHLVLRLQNIDEVFLSIPIKAKCLVPEIYIEQPEVDYGDCFLHHPHEELLNLCNTSDLNARFEIQNQEESSRDAAWFCADVNSGILLQKSTTRVTVSLMCQKLGKVRLPLCVQILGSPLLPLSATLKATSIGPIVEITPQEINFGNVTCLTEHVQKVQLTNVSPISASFRTHIKSSCSRFSINQKQGVIPPNDVLIMKVIACSDDTVISKDILQISIMNGVTLTVPLSLRGTGSTIWSSRDLRLIDFGDQFSHTECEYSFTLENKGKRPQVLTWVNIPANDAEATDMISSKKNSRISTTKNTNLRSDNALRIRARDSIIQVDALKSEVHPAFTIFPSTVELLPRTACVFAIKGLSTKTGLMTEQHICEARTGKEKINKIAFTSEVRANFLDPYLEPSLSKILFKYMHTSQSTLEIIPPKEEILRLTNVCKLPLTFSVRTQMPFSVDISETVLQPAASLDCNVLCYPGFKDDFMSRNVAGKISISYWGHPKRDIIDLEAEINFPNLSFETELIDFGCIINETQKTQTLRVTNGSQVTARYDWVYIEDESHDTFIADKKTRIPASKAFNVVPASGSLQPNESDMAEFTFYGHTNSKFKCRIACQVQGGPSYEIDLQGEASTLAYKLDKHHLDYGSIRYDKTEEREITIANTGKVSLPFACVLPDQQSSCRAIEIIPISGKIASGEKQRISVRVCPGVPEYFEEAIWIELAYFEPIAITVSGYGLFSTWSCTLPRDPELCYSLGEKVLDWSELRRIAHINLSKSIPIKVKDIELRSGTTNTSSDIRESEQKSKNYGKNVPTLDEYDIDSEASRILFSEYLRNKNQIDNLSCPSNPKRVISSPLTSNDTKDETIVQHRKKTLQIVKTPDSRSANNNPNDALSHPKIDRRPLPFVLSQFTLDFGNVIHGMHKVKKFKLTNIGGMPASFQFDKNLATAKGFCIEPDRVLRIPEKQSIEITVTFQAKKAFTPGHRQVSLPIIAKHGPTTLITIRATVVVPEITPSRENIDFGRVMIGNGRTEFLQLQNVSNVPAEWVIKKAVGGTKEESVFRFSPSSGNLLSSSKVNIQIDYEPISGRQSHLKLTLQVTANPRAKTIVCRGEGSELQISFSPPIVELGPILPCIKTATAFADMRNDSEYPVEVVSLDFDKEYLKDEELIRSIPAFDSNNALTGCGLTNRLCLPPREPGKSLKQYLLERNLLQSPVSPHNNDNNEGSNDNAHVRSSIVEGTALGKHHTAGVRNPSAIDYIMFGPPGSGRSTQANLLAQKENLNVWTIDGAIKMVTRTQSDGASYLIRNLQLVNILSIPASDPANEDQSSDGDPNDTVIDFTPSAVLSQVICWRLCQPDMHNGSVLDDIQRCSHATFALALEALQESLVSARVIVINIGESAYDNFLQEKVESGHITESMSDTKNSPIDTSVDRAVIDSEEQASNQSIQDEVFPPSSSKTIRYGPESVLGMQTWSEYKTTVDEMRFFLQKFLSRKFRESSTASEMMFTKQIPIETASTENTASGPTEANSEFIPTPENFLLEIEITECGPPLVLHNMIITAMETYIKEIEAAYLPIPAPVTYYLLNPPTMRPPRRSVQDFLLEAPNSSTEQYLALSNSIVQEEEFVTNSEQTRRLKKLTRWIIPSKESVQIQIIFTAKQPGFFEATLGFEITGSQREFGLLCRGYALVPSINCDPRNIFMNRVKNHPKKAHVSKKFVLSENQLQFGPLILPFSESNPTTEEGWQHLLVATKSQSSARRQQNVELLRISNATAFVAEVSLAMESLSNVFSLYPTFLSLSEGETAEVLLCANPTSDGVFDDHLVCCVKDNPETAIFAVSCLGCVPVLSLRDCTTDTSSVGTSCIKDTSESTIKASIVVNFDRVLLKRPDTRMVLIENKCAVSIHWRLDKSQLSLDFDVTPTEGVIKSGQQSTLSITFTALNEGIHEHTFSIVYADKLSKFEEPKNSQLLTVFSCAEAYTIDVCVFETEESNTPSNGILDFGLIRIGDIACQNLQLRNRGKYDIKYIIKTLSKRAGRLFKIEPLQDVVIPGNSKNINVQLQSDEEITLQNYKEINCTIVEMITKETCHQFPLIINAKVVGSRYRIQPAQGINFGHHKYNDPPITEVLEIKNEGDFMFTFRLLPASSSSRNSDLKMVPDSVSKEQSPADLSIGQFSISPDRGKIDPGITKIINVIFRPKDCQIYLESLIIEVSGCEGSVNDKEPELKKMKSIQYEVTGESCYPRIVTNDFDSIFEEQIVVATLDIPSANAIPHVSNLSMYPKSAIYSEDDNTFYFGAVLASTKSTGHAERFKITNPTKVNAQVRFEIENLENVSGTTSSTLGEPTTEKPFTVQPSVWDIPPQEHRFINVHFKPNVIKSYKAKLFAKVEDSRDQSSDLTFELRGEGTLPCITVAEPSLRDTVDSRLMLTFGRVPLSKSKRRSLVLRNDGILTAHISLSISENRDFYIERNVTSAAIAPGISEEFYVVFKPSRVHEQDIVTSEIIIQVQGNPYDDTIIKVQGTAFRNDVIFEDLGNDRDTELQFDDVILGYLRDDSALYVNEIRDSTIIFSIRNQITDVIRFQWPTLEKFSFSPRIGHLAPGSSAIVTATFSPYFEQFESVIERFGSLGAKIKMESSGPSATNTNLSSEMLSSICSLTKSMNLRVQNLIAQLEVKAIQYIHTTTNEGKRLVNWDDQAITVEFKEPARQDGAPTEMLQLDEPAYEAIRDAKSIPIEFFAAADLLRFGCSESKLVFQPTYMLQSCTHDVRIENQSEVRISYAWHWSRRCNEGNSAFDSPATEKFADSGFLPFGSDLGMQMECPFEIYPNHGVIQAKTTETFTIRFSPVEVNEFAYNLVFEADTVLRHLSIDRGKKPFSESQKPRLEIDVTGRSLRPVCHFDLELSNYAQHTSIKQNGSQNDRSRLDSSCHVIEIHSLGVRVRNTRHFHVVNTTNVAYEFAWVPEGIFSSCFRFVTSKGLLSPGKRFEMIVEFTPHHLEPQESFWRFEIPHFQLSQRFLVVGTTKEPKLMLDRGNINFNMSLIGKKSLQTVYIINQEQIPFDFVFDKTSIDCSGDISSLGIYPLSGTIPPNGKAQVDVQFVPKEEKSYNFNLICIIKRKPARLSLNVKGEGFDVHESLLIYKVQTEAGEINDAPNDKLAQAGIRLSAKMLHVIDFGTVQLDVEAVEAIEIQNKGKYDFNFHWYSHPSSYSKSLSKAYKSNKMLKEKNQFKSPGSPRHLKVESVTSPSLAAHFISISPIEGTVKPNEKAICRILFHPSKQICLNGVKIGCSIGTLRNYTFSLTGAAIPPLVRFSFTSHDFGPCFISGTESNLTLDVKELVIYNLDDQIMQIDCIYDKQPHLRIDCGHTNVIHPNEALTVKLIFNPRQEMCYTEQVPFIINGTSTVNVSARGEGVLAKVELVKMSMKTVAFGSIQVGQCVSRTVRLINRCKRRVSFFLQDSTQNGDPTSSLETSQVSLLPQKDISLRPKETADIVCRYSPTRRAPPFRNYVAANIGGTIQSLFTLTGSCMGTDVRLEPDTVVFGTVCLGSYLKRKVVMKNLGDVVAKFRWDLAKLSPHFTISTVQGSIAPTKHITIDILFKPLHVSSDIRVDRLLGVIEGSDPVHLSLRGQCVMQEATSIIELNFESRVREKSSKTATIENKTKEAWNLIPVLQGDQWSCQENVIVPAGGAGILNIVYHPISMTQHSENPNEEKNHDADLELDKQHEGSLFVAIPNGTALSYKLYGRASAPACTEKLQFTVSAKKYLHIPLPVTNWLSHQPQTFCVGMIRAPQPPAVLVQYPSSMVLPAGATKTCTLKFYSYTERTEDFEICFKNSKTREYLFYEVNVVVTPAAEIEVIKLSALLRQEIKRQITIENPFYENASTKSRAKISYVNPKQWWKCTSPQIVRVAQVTSISQQPEGIFEVEYRPFLHFAQPKEAILTISFVELGDYIYRLILSTLPPSIDSILRFQAPLGRSHVQLYNFTTYNEARGELKCRIEGKSAFSVPSIRKIDGSTSWEGRTASLQVTFEPEEIGEVKGSLILFSENIGEYTCSLLGCGAPPQPQGPLVLTEGALDIEFRNVFSKAQDFELQIDNADFQLSTKILSIPVKSSKIITIKSTSSAGNDQEKHPLVGKLSIYLCSDKQIPPWVYYIEKTMDTG